LTGYIVNTNAIGEVFGFDNNGTRSLGTINTGSVNGAYVRDQQSGVMTILGSLYPGWTGNAIDMSEDGNVIVGRDTNSLASEGWVWTSSDGIVSLHDRLAAAGVTGLPSNFQEIWGCSDDGSVIVGGNLGLPGFIVELPILVSYGAGTPGCNGFANLTASPAPQVNTPTFTMTSTNVPPGSLGLTLITNTADVNGTDPFSIGAKLHVNLFTSTDTSTLDAFSDAFGNGTATATIPNSPFLAGLTYYAQTLWAWPVSTCFIPPYNLSTTNGLGITILP
jgi:hypothetical protein